MKSHITAFIGFERAHLLHHPNVYFGHKFSASDLLLHSFQYQMTAGNEMKRWNGNSRRSSSLLAHNHESWRYEEREGFQMTFILFTSFTAVQLFPGDQDEKAENW